MSENKNSIIYRNYDYDYDYDSPSTPPRDLKIMTENDYIYHIQGLVGYNVTYYIKYREKFYDKHFTNDNGDENYCIGISESILNNNEGINPYEIFNKQDSGYIYFDLIPPLWDENFFSDGNFDKRIPFCCFNKDKLGYIKKGSNVISIENYNIIISSSKELTPLGKFNFSLHMRLYGVAINDQNYSVASFSWSTNEDARIYHTKFYSIYYGNINEIPLFSETKIINNNENYRVNKIKLSFDNQEKTQTYGISDDIVHEMNFTKSMSEALVVQPKIEIEWAINFPTVLTIKLPSIIYNIDGLTVGSYNLSNMHYVYGVYSSSSEWADWYTYTINAYADGSNIYIGEELPVGYQYLVIPLKIEKNGDSIIVPILIYFNYDGSSTTINITNSNIHFLMSHRYMGYELYNHGVHYESDVNIRMGVYKNGEYDIASDRTYFDFIWGNLILKTDNFDGYVNCNIGGTSNRDIYVSTTARQYSLASLINANYSTVYDLANIINISDGLFINFYKE